MHKLYKILLCILLCACLFGCSYPNDAENSTAQSVTTQNCVTEDTGDLTASTSTTAVSQQKGEDKSSLTTESKKTKEEKQTTKFTKNSQKFTKSSKTYVVSYNHKNQKTTKKSYTTHSAQTLEEQKNSTSNQSPSTTVTETTTTSSIITCEVTVECTSIFDNMDKLKKGHEAYLPADGIIINTYTVTLDSGATAYDAIVTACNDKNVKLTQSNDGFGKYIIGFNNIDEKDCGKQSGWIYKINGFKPMKSCNKYQLSNGDKVLFSYTCSY